jgi:hypothetical protein
MLIRLRLAMAALATAAAVSSVDEGSAAENDAGESPPCDSVEVDYALSANLELADTPMGQGDSKHRIGPGRARMRYAARVGAIAGPAELIHYQTTERFVVTSQTLFWRTRVRAQTETTVQPDACGVVARAVLADRELSWTSAMRGVRTDGTLTCEGSLCGSFGAPPPGTSAVHVPPHEVRLKSWRFAPDRRTFTMERTWVARSESPQQTSFIALAGREVTRRCVVVPPCRPADSGARR